MLKSGVDVYGGFAGTGKADPDQRDLASYVATLSGDIGIEGDMSDNGYHVVYAFDVIDVTLDRFTITAGNAGGLSGDIRYGGGMHNHSRSPTRSNVTFHGNSPGYGGEGMANDDSGSPTDVRNHRIRWNPDALDPVFGGWTTRSP